MVMQQDGPARHLKIAPGKSAVIQEMLPERRKRPRRIQESSLPQYDELYFKVMRAMAEEEKPKRRILGKAEITPEAANAISQQGE